MQHASFLSLRHPSLALASLLSAVLLAGAEAACVQLVTTHQPINAELLHSSSFLLLFCLDMLVPLTLALLSRRCFIVFLLGQSLLSTILLHYDIFFYNPLTLSTIYHSVQGAGALGLHIFSFTRLNVVACMLALTCLKVFLVLLSRRADTRMPRMWMWRGAIAVSCMTLICWISMLIYGKTGLSLLWIDSRGHRTATERRLEEGTQEAVKSIGYLATWIGEFLSGTYTDTALIYAETRCTDPNSMRRIFCEHSTSTLEDLPLATANNTGNARLHSASTLEDLPLAEEHAICIAQTRKRWDAIPLPPVASKVVLLQIESLDFATLGMRVNDHAVVPFLEQLASTSVLLKSYAPHKVGSSNSDYEIFNARVASQNVMYYSYITSYPDSVIHLLTQQGYAPELFHGLPGELFNLRSAYTSQGFTRSFFKEELVQAGYTPSTYIMAHMTDKDVFHMAGTRLHAHAKQAQCIITMSSHIPFMQPLPQFTRPGGTFSRYISSLHYVDQQLASYYAALPQGTLLIIWGDHGSDVTYPQSMPANSRHVPFIVHVKGNDTWLDKNRHSHASCIALAPTQPAAHVPPGTEVAFTKVPGTTQTSLPVMAETAVPVTAEAAVPVTADPMPTGTHNRQTTLCLTTAREYTLCELAYLLRAIFSQPTAQSQQPEQPQ